MGRPLSRAEMWDQLVMNWYPGDPFEPGDAVRRYYETKYAIAAELRPRSICEIGVRAGYSAFAFLAAVPEAEYLGIDNGLSDREDKARYLEHADRILQQGIPPACLRRIRIEDIQRLRHLPAMRDGSPYALVHVDGDHSHAGCAHDLALAAAGARWILVDDFDTGLPIRAACQRFVLDHAEWRAEYIPDGLAGNLLLTRRP